MTYKELLEIIQALPTERLTDTVTVCEPYEEQYIAVIDGYNIADEGYLVLNLKG